MNTKHQLLCAWSGLVFLVIFMLGWLVIGGFVPPPSSAASAMEIADFYKQNTTLIREKLFEFLSGWLGGPQLFIEKYGHPRLRGRHMPFAIGESERDQWMLCMLQAMAEITMTAKLREHLEEAFMKTADFMRNH